MPEETIRHKGRKPFDRKSNRRRGLVSFSKEARPEIGDEYYIDSALYLTHARDDRVGGLVRINAIEERERNFWVSVDGFPGIRFGIAKGGPNAWGGKEWKKKQEELKEKFGNKRARSTPDYSPEFNER